MIFSLFPLYLREMQQIMPILTGFAAFDDFSSRKYVNSTLLCLCIDRLMSEIDSSFHVARRKRDRSIVLKLSVASIGLQIN